MARIASEIIYKIIGDETDLVKSLQKAEKDTAAFGKKLEGIGKKLSLGLTAPIVAAGTAAVKLASDTGEAFNAANVVFRESTGIIEAWGKNAVEQAGLTSAEFYQASAVIGAGLINAGQSADEAAKQTIELTKRAADMASIFNTDVNDALLALQSGLRGESEPLRRFAVNLNEAAVNAKAVELGLAASEKEVSDYAKSQARLSLILEQTNRFQGDFVNTSDQLANGTRILQASIKEQAAELGQALLPAVLQIVSKGRELVTAFSELDANGKKLVLTIAGIAAALGPVITLAGKLIAGGPTALGIAAVATAFGVMALNISKAHAEFNKLKNITEGGTTGNLADDLKVVSDRIGTIKAQIGSSEGLIPGETAELEAELASLEKIRASLVDKARGQAATLKYASEEEKARAKEAISAADSAKATEASAAITEKYKQSRKLVLDALGKEKTEYQLIQEKIDAISATPWATGQLEKDRLAALEALRARQAEIVAEEDAKAKALADARGDEIIRLAQLKDQEHQKDLDRIDAEKQARIKATTEFLSFASSAFSTLGNISQNYANQQIALLDAELQKTLQANGVAEKSTIEKLQSELQENKDKLAAETDEKKRSELEKTIAEKEQAIKREEITKEFENKKAKVSYEAALAQWRLNLLQATAESARAIIIAATSAPFPASLPAIGFAAALGGLQLASISGARPIEPPSFAQGTRNFMVPPGFPNDSFPIMVQSGERVTVETPQQQAGEHGERMVFQIGTVIADPAGLRDLDRLLRKYGAVEDARRG